MKKLFWALLSVLLVTTLSCGKQPEPTIDPSGDSTQKTDSGDPYASDDPSSISDPSGDYERGGMVISSKAEGNSNSIYLPGTDFCVGTQVGKYAGERGNYCQAYSLLVVEKNSGRDLNGHNRYLGFSVRPVTE